MAKTYEPIATQTLGSSQATVTFSSIPQTYTDLVAVIDSKVTSGTLQLFSRVGNGSADTGANYSGTQLDGSGSAAYSRRWDNQNYWQGYYDYMDTNRGFIQIMNILNYTNTTTFKSAIWRAGNVNTGVAAQIGLWRSTSAINVVSFFPSGGGSFATGSTFTLYGIKAA